MLRRIIGRYHNVYLDRSIGSNHGVALQSRSTASLTLKPGGTLAIGEARVEYSENGRIEACDLYGCYTALADTGTPVYIRPVPGIYRLQRFSPFIYIEFESKLYISNSSLYWVLAPLDLEVYIGSSLLGVVSPTKVKYTLIGDVLDGTICRYFRASAKKAYPPRLGESLAAGILGFHVAAKSDAIIPGIGFNAMRSSLYRSGDGLVFYSLVEVEVDGGKLVARVQEKPPMRSLVQVYKPRHIALGVVQQLQPFTMQV